MLALFVALSRLHFETSSIWSSGRRRGGFSAPAPKSYDQGVIRQVLFCALSGPVVLFNGKNKTVGSAGI